MPEPLRADCAVIGAGVIGSAVALRLRQAGATVALLERGVPGREATWASAGMLSPQAEADSPGPALDFGLRSRDMYPAFAEELRELSGIDIGYRQCGVLWVAVSEEDETVLRRRVSWQREAGLTIDVLDEKALRDAEPALSAAVRLGAFIPGDHRVDARLLVTALAQGAARAGVRILSGSRVRRILVHEGRVCGVEAEGVQVAAPTVVVAAGAWSAHLDGTALVPGTVRPVRGQMLLLQPGVRPLQRVVFGSQGYLVPDQRGGILAGSTMEEAGFATEVTVAGMSGILANTLRLVPSLGEAAVVELWSGLRPLTTDGRAILGPGPVPGLVYATGHGRKGVLHAPLTATVIAQVVMGRPPGVDLEPFAWSRFAADRSAATRPDA